MVKSKNKTDKRFVKMYQIRQASRQGVKLEYKELIDNDEKCK